MSFTQKNYHERENELFEKISELYENNELSEGCRENFEVLLRILELHNSVKYSSLKELNADVTQKFTALLKHWNIGNFTNKKYRQQAVSVRFAVFAPACAFGVNITRFRLSLHFKNRKTIEQQNIE
jgi:hypothetical protein